MAHTYIVRFEDGRSREFLTYRDAWRYALHDEALGKSWILERGPDGSETLKHTLM